MKSNDEKRLFEAFRQIAKADGFEARYDKLCEETLETISARSVLHIDPHNEKFKKHLVEELADMAVCIEILVEALDEREGYEAVKCFKTYREVCRRWLKEPKWCASNPVKEEPEDDE